MERKGYPQSQRAVRCRPTRKCHIFWQQPGEPAILVLPHCWKPREAIPSNSTS